MWVEVNMASRAKAHAAETPRTSVLDQPRPSPEWSALGKKLWQIRKDIEAAGEATLTHEEAMEEARRGRAGHSLV